MANGGLVRGIAGPCPPRIQKHGMATQRRVTEILISLRDGDRQAFDELVPLVYNELKRIPRSKLRLERSGHTLSTTALINEAPPSTAPLPRWPPRSGTPAFPMTRSSRRRSGYKWQQNCCNQGDPKSRIDLEVVAPDAYPARRRGAGEVERGGLENRCPRKWTVGSNPTPSARIRGAHRLRAAGPNP